jgi:hypothetical protein
VPRYQEAAEAQNGTREGAEATGQTVTAGGFAIDGMFEGGTPSTDLYQIDTGTFGGMGKPDFPGIDVFVVIDGQRLGTAETRVSLTLDAVANDGYSTLRGGGFSNAAVTRGVPYLLGISGSAAFAGKRYTLEVRGH